MLRKLVLIVCTFSPAALTAAPPPEKEMSPPTQPGGDAAVPSRLETVPPPHAEMEGLWPSRKLMDLMLARWTDEISDEYELDDVQRLKIREAAVKRWGTFLTDNRTAIQPLANEFIEMRLELEPPSKERIQAWAERAVPVFDQFHEQVNRGTDEFREILNPLQRAKFERRVLEFGVGVQVARQKLKQWKTGEFDVNEFWEPTPDRRHSRRAERRRRRREEAKITEAATAAPEETDQIALELKAWDKYVEKFIQIYGLDEGQRTAVLSCLSELKQRAVAHRDRRREDIAKLEKRISSFAGSDEQLAELKQQLSELYGPVDDMFRELKRRIEQIPTAEQRAAVARNGE